MNIAPINVMFRSSVNIIVIGVAFMLILPPPGFGATYFVSLTGSDSNSGSDSYPLRTVQKAANLAQLGDIIEVAPGEYNEYVSTKAAGMPDRPITFRASGQVSIRAFRALHPFVTLDGFTLKGVQNAWGAHVRIEAAAHNTLITNCFIGPGVYAISDDLVFDAPTSTLTSKKINWRASGFEAGGKIFTGGSGMEKYWYVNHDKAWTISSISDGVMHLSGNWEIETNKVAWAPVYAGGNSAGIEGIMFITSGGVAASNCTFTHNTFSNLFGPAITLKGNNHTVANNIFTRLNSYYGIRPNGNNINIYSNLWYNCTNFIQYTGEEIQNIPHPAGPAWYDYHVGFIHATGAGTNIHFWRNWIENVHNPLGQINETEGAYGFYLRSNVFVGVAANLSGGRAGFKIENNTFYRVAYDYPAASALTVGGNSPDRLMSDLSIRSNVFVDVGSRRSFNLEGFYGVVNALAPVTEYNFVAAPETCSWSGKRSFVEASGFNGGDPLFVDAGSPRGADGIPFTDDDGLKPLPHSIIAQQNLGALAPAFRGSSPVAHFSIDSLSSGLRWHDKLGLEFDAIWQTLPPFARSNKVRPYSTPEALGVFPVTVRFSAAASQASASANQLVEYTWDFGDGTTRKSTSHVVEHSYRQPGSFTVSLSVSDSSGQNASVSKQYRVLATSGPRPVKPTGFRIRTP